VDVVPVDLMVVDLFCCCSNKSLITNNLATQTEESELIERMAIGSMCSWQGEGEGGKGR
jgi:hypothetical protein